MQAIGKVVEWFKWFAHSEDLELPQWRRRLATLMGALLIGLIALLFARAGDFAQMSFGGWSEREPLLPLLITPLVFAVVAWLTGKVALEARGSGIPQVIAAARDPEGQEEQGLISLRADAAKLVLTVAALFGGPSVGREGPTVQLAAAIMVAALRFFQVRVTPGRADRGWGGRRRRGVQYTACRDRHCHRGARGRL